MRNLSLRIKCSFSKLIPHFFVPHSFIPHSLSLDHISEIKLFILKWENYSVRIIFSETPVLLISHVDISEINISAA